MLEKYLKVKSYLIYRHHDSNVNLTKRAHLFNLHHPPSIDKLPNCHIKKSPATYFAGLSSTKLNQTL